MFVAGENSERWRLHQGGGGVVQKLLMKKMVMGVDCSLCICVEVENEDGVGCRLQSV